MPKKAKSKNQPKYFKKIFPLFLVGVGVLIISCVAISYKNNTISKAENLQIVGGRNVTKEEFPSVVRINENDCTGVLVRPRWVLTAAHCIHEGEPIYVFGGLIYRLPLSKKTGVITTIKHENFSYDDETNDLALLLLDTEFKSVSLPILPQKSLDEDIYTKGNEMEVVGWGWREFDKPAITLQEIDLPVFASFRDENPYTFQVGFEGEKALTQNVGHGDSGGPVFYRKNGELILAGIVSLGDQDRNFMVNEPFTASKIIHYSDWINKTINSVVLPSPKPTQVLNKSLINPKQLLQVCDQYKTEADCNKRGLSQGCAFHHKCYACVPILFSLVPYSVDYCNWVYEQIRIESGGDVKQLK